MKFDILTIFPEIFKSYFNESLFRRALKVRLVDVEIHNLRDYAKDRRGTVDDKPYGGGPGMVLKLEPIAGAVANIRRQASRKKMKTRVVLFSTRGKILDQKTARRMAKYDNLVLICGRYEGVDERVAKFVADEEISIGDYILSGGELPAMVFAEAVSRHIKGFLGKYESLEEIKGTHPAYTRPPIFKAKIGKRNKNMKVPPVLLRGNHAQIQAWRGKFRKFN